MSVQRKLYPEIGAGGFSRTDGSVEFYGRIGALLRSDMVVLDFGAGRGVPVQDENPYRSQLADFRGRVHEVIGVDVDDAVSDNPGLDRAVVIAAGDPLPLDDASVDLVVSRYVFEHVRSPEQTTAELTRVLKPGGWICACTPNKWGYIGIAARAVPNAAHVSLLRRLQPAKAEEDTFPVAYRLNTRRDLRRYFPPSQFEDCSYGYDPEPAYFADSVVGWRAAQAAFRILPPQLAATLHVFMRKR